MYATGLRPLPEIIYLPAYIVSELNFREKKVSEILDFSLVSQYLSVDDFVNILLLNDKETPLNALEENKVQLKYGESNPLNYLVKKWTETTKDRDDVLAILGNVTSLYDIVQGKPDTYFRIFNDNVKENIADGNGLNRTIYEDTLVIPEKKYSLVNIENEVFVILEKDLNLLDGTIYKRTIKSLIKDVLKMFYRYQNIETVSQSDWFKIYLELSNPESFLR